MGTMFFMLAVIVIVPLAIIVWAVNEVCSALEGRSIFHGVIPEDRAKFFQETFGLTVDEMGQFHFDGCLFHVGNGVPYWELKSITCTEVRDVSVVNSQLPHTSSWQHERVNGGPDRRYKNNAITRTSRRFQLLFVAASEYRFVIYSQPSSYYASKVNDALQKINKFLAISQIIDLEASFNEYSKAFHIIQGSSKSLDVVKSKKLEAETALSASRRLVAQNAAVSNSLIPKQNQMLAEIRQFDSEVMRFQQEIIFAQEKMKSIAQNIRAQIALLKDVQIVQSYGASRSLGMNAANESGSSASVKRQLIGSNEESKPSAEEETALRKGERKKKNTTRQMLTGVGVLAIMGLALMAFSLQSLQLPIGSASVNTAVTNSNRSSSSDTQEPVDVVASYMQAFAGQQFDKMKSLACPENDNFVKSIDFGSQLAETLQVDRSTIIDAIDIRMSNMTYKEFVRRDTSASVSVKGHFDLVIDREKMRVVIEMASKAKQNTDWDQSKINEVTDNIIKNFASGQDFNATSDLVLRDGKWLICE